MIIDGRVVPRRRRRYRLAGTEIWFRSVAPATCKRIAWELANLAEAGSPRYERLARLAMIGAAWDEPDRVLATRRGPDESFARYLRRLRAELRAWGFIEADLRAAAELVYGLTGEFVREVTTG